MPLYEYHCSSCDQTYELLQKVDAAKTAPCDCGGLGERIMSAFVAKGISPDANDFYQGERNPAKRAKMRSSEMIQQLSGKPKPVLSDS